MLRTFLKARKRKISLNIPEQYWGKELEIIIFSKDEDFMSHEYSEKNVTFSALDIDTKRFKFNREEANER